MAQRAFTSRSAVLIMHAVFYVPSVVAVPRLRPVHAPECAGQCIPGLKSKRNNVRNEVSVQSSANIAGGRVAVGYVRINSTHGPGGLDPARNLAKGWNLGLYFLQRV